MSTISACVCPSEIQIGYLIDAARKSQVNNSAAYSRLALLAYELIINLGREKELIWEQKWRASTLIYFLLRYPVFAFQIFNVYTSAYTSSSQYEQAYQQSFCLECPPNCDTLNRFTWALTIIPTRLAITASFVLRVYAILALGRAGLILAILLGTVGLSSVALDIWQDAQMTCSTPTNPISTILTFFLLAAFDIIATGIIIFRAITLFREAGWRVLRSSGIFSALVQQGLIYFSTVTIVQLVVILLYYLPQGTYSLILNNYSLFLSSILLSRFVLDLRELHAHPHRTPWSEGNTQTFTSMRFRSAQTDSGGGLAGAVRDFEDVLSRGSIADTVGSDSTEDPSETCIECHEVHLRT